MRILVDIGHPAHVHFYKHAIRRWQDEGHEVLITARDKDVALSLLDHYGFSYQVLSSAAQSQRGLYVEYLRREWALVRFMKESKPHVVTAVGGVFIAPAGRLLAIPSVVFTDTEHVALDRYLTYPLATAIYTPTCFNKDLGRRHRQYRGFHELAYLHPDYFTPDLQVLERLDIGTGEPYTLMRLVAWEASHDLGHKGFSSEIRNEAVARMQEFGRVLISSEGPLPSQYEHLRTKIPPQDIHHVLAFSRLYFGEGATMATEAALLGTPSIYVSSLAATMGNFDLLAQYGLVDSFQEGAPGLERAIALLRGDESKERVTAARDGLLLTLCDVTDLIVSVITQFAKNEPHKQTAALS